MSPDNRQSSTREAPPTAAAADPAQDLARAQFVQGYSLPQYFYTSDERHAKDMDIWRRKHWLLVDHESAIGEVGSFIVRNCGGESLIIVRDKSDVVRAFHNVCRHRGSILCMEEQGKTRGFVCPYHAWNFGLDGSLRAARSMPADFDKSQFGLLECNVGVSHGLIFVNFAEQAPDFHEFVGRFAPYLSHYGIGNAQVARREVYPVESNWKGVAENLGECYHCAPAHPTYSRMQDVDLVPLGADAMAERDDADQRTAHAPFLPPISDPPDSPYLQGAGCHAIGRGRRTGAVGGNQVAPLMGDLKEFDGLSGGITFNPLSFIVFYPDYAFFATFVPRSTLRTDIEVVWLVNGSAVSGVDFDPQIVSHLWDLTTKEDQVIIGANQRGISSNGYRPGPYSLDEIRVVETVDWYLQHFVDGD